METGVTGGTGLGNAPCSGLSKGSERERRGEVAMKTEYVMLRLYGLQGKAERALAVQSALSHVIGVLRADVDLASEMAHVEYDPLRAGITELLIAIERAGLRACEPVRC